MTAQLDFNTVARGKKTDMENPIGHYLTDVLGVRDFVRPQTPVSPVAVYTSRPVSKEESELLGKMMSAIQVKDYIIVDQEFSPSSSDVQPVGLVLGGLALRRIQPQAESLSPWLGQIAKVGPQQWMVSHDLADLLSGLDPARQQALKRETWAHLQQFKKALQNV